MLIKKCKTGGAFEALPEKQFNLDLNKIKSKFKIVSNLSMLIIVRCQGYDVTCYKNGKLLIKNCEDEIKAEKIAGEIYGSVQ